MLWNNKRSNRRVRAFVAAAGVAAAWLLTAAVGTGVMPTRAWGASPNWQDLESRIQYGYYTEDARSLMGVIELLRPGESEDAMKSYYAALANYRVTLLTSGSDKARAKDTAEQCVSSLDRALRERAAFADAFALQAACLDRLAGLEPWRSPFAASKSGTQIQRARHLAPRNPRVLLLDAVEDYEGPKASAADKERALAKFKQAAAAFEAERQGEDHVPGWGAAEAYVFLARCYLDHGDTLAARDALERALLIAPEFGQARRMMSKIITG